jgi:type VI secretion system protein ImpB
MGRDEGSHWTQGFVAPPEPVWFKLPFRPANEDAELGLSLLCIGDFTGREDPRPVEDRRPKSVNSYNFERVLREQDLWLSFEVPNRLGVAATGEKAPLQVNLHFTVLRHFRPESIAHQVPELRDIVELREGLTTLKGLLGEEAFRNALQRVLRDPVSRRRLREEIGLPDVDEDLAAPPPSVPLLPAPPWKK